MAFLELGGEEILMLSVPEPPRPLAVDVAVRRLVNRTRRGFNSIGAA